MIHMSAYDMQRTINMDIIETAISHKTTTTVEAIEKETGLPRHTIIQELQRLESRGVGKFTVGRRGMSSRFQRYTQPITTAISVHVTVKPERLQELLAIVESMDLHRAA